jgi:hypothetical protein
MLYLFLIITYPFIVWLWLGINLTMIDFAITWLKLIEERQMTEAMEKETNRPARLIRYTDLNEDTMPGLLSFFEEEKNILHIDKTLANALPTFDRHRLEMTEIVFTKLSDDGGLRFTKYN